APALATSTSAIASTSSTPAFALPQTTLPARVPSASTSYSLARFEDLDELTAVLHSLNVDDMLNFLSGRRVPGSNVSSDEAPVVMSVSIARNPQPGPGEDAFRVLVRTNLSERAEVYPCPDDDEVDDDGPAFSTAPPSPSRTPEPRSSRTPEPSSSRTPEPSSPNVSAISIISTPPSTPSLHSVPASSVAGAAQDAPDIAAIEAPVPMLRRSHCPCANCRRKMHMEAPDNARHSQGSAGGSAQQRYVGAATGLEELLDGDEWQNVR
ncbi:hypothetical protein FA95DRAFT_1578953, partial [Auriscalpium vulgare]